MQSGLIVLNFRETLLRMLHTFKDLSTSLPPQYAWGGKLIEDTQKLHNHDAHGSNGREIWVPRGMDQDLHQVLRFPELADSCESGQWSFMKICMTRRSVLLSGSVILVRNVHDSVEIGVHYFQCVFFNHRQGVRCFGRDCPTIYWNDLAQRTFCIFSLYINCDVLEVGARKFGSQAVR